MTPMDKAVPEGNDISILVVSCDKYHDLWAPFFTLFFGIGRTVHTRFISVLTQVPTMIRG